MMAVGAGVTVCGCANNSAEAGRWRRALAFALVEHGRFLSFEGGQVGEDVALLGRCAGAADHVIAVALEPLLDLRDVGQSFRIGGRCERCDRTTGGRMAARGERIFVWQVEQLQSVPWRA